jgi:hypothetical protein
VVSGLDLKKNPDLLHPIDQFKTKIFGHFDGNLSEGKLKFIPSGILAQLQPERNFVTKISSSWVRFWAPKLQGN